MSAFRHDFSQELSEAIAWVSKRDFENWKKSKFRTNDLHTCPNLDELFQPENCSLDSVRSVVNEVVQQRRSLVADRNSISDETLSRGRLLRHDLAETTFTTEPQAITNGFFDECDVPAWDVWLGIVEDSEHPMSGYLIAWVPDELVPEVGKAIKHSFEENIRWVD